MHYAETVKATYEHIMEKSKLLVEMKTTELELPPTEDQYIVLNLTAQTLSREKQNHDQDLELTQVGIVRFITVISEIVSGWGGTLIEANHHSVTSTFPISEPDAGSYSCMCGLQIFNAITKIINPSLIRDGIDMSFQCGVGISIGSVYGFQTGLEVPLNSLYYGEAIESAVEYANMSSGSVIVDRLVKERFERVSSDFKINFLPYRHHEWVGYKMNVG